MTTEQTRQLGRELVAELAQDAGDPEAVRAVLRAWLDREDVSRLAFASMAGLQLVFADCLTRTPIGAWTLNPPPERTP